LRCVYNERHATEATFVARQANTVNNRLESMMRS
jgi:hypothetical protein